MGTNCSLFLKEDGLFKNRCYLDRWYVFADDFESGITMPRQVMLNKLKKLKKKIINNELDSDYDKKHHLTWVCKTIDELLSNCDVEEVVLAADFDIEPCAGSITKMCPIIKNIGILHKSYDEFKVEILHGFYTVLEIERILRSAKVAIKATKEITTEMANGC